MSELKGRITDSIKDAMRAGDKPRVATLRLITAAIKQREVDERKELGDDEIVAVLAKMVKQRRESIEQYDNAGRQDLADKERAEIEIINDFLPQPLSPEEIDAAIDRAISETGAESIKDMGKVMSLLRPQMQGRADLSAVSARIKARLGG